jgi:hypothetical protein
VETLTLLKKKKKKKKQGRVLLFLGKFLMNELGGMVLNFNLFSVRFSPQATTEFLMPDSQHSRRERSWGYPFACKRSAQEKDCFCTGSLTQVKR